MKILQRSILIWFLIVPTSCAGESPESLFKAEIRRMRKQIQSIRYERDISEPVQLENGSIRIRRSVIKNKEMDVIRIASEIYSIAGNLGALADDAPVVWQDDAAYGEVVAYLFAYMFTIEVSPEKAREYYVPFISRIQSIYNMRNGNEQLEEWTKKELSKTGLDIDLLIDISFASHRNELEQAQAVLVTIAAPLLLRDAKYQEGIDLFENIVTRYPKDQIAREASRTIQLFRSELQEKNN